MNLRIIKAGVLDTVQDRGRYGFQHLGINPGGAMDKFAAQAANILVGNDPGDAVIELHFPASEFFFEQPALIAVTGAAFEACVNGEPVENGQPLIVSRYSILQFTRLQQGARAYLAVHGGLDISPWLGSRSTLLKAGAGGYKGRALQKEDMIALKPLPEKLLQLTGKKEYHILPWKAEPYREEEEQGILMILPGNEWEELDTESQARFIQEPFVLMPQSDRMGYRLKGRSLRRKTSEEIISSAVGFGTLQLLPGGQLILLMADHQTAGGYPRVGHVITAHHSRAAQLRAGEEVYFRFTGQARAEASYLRQQQYLLQLQNACTFRLASYL